MPRLLLSGTSEAYPTVMASMRAHPGTHLLRKSSHGDRGPWSERADVDPLRGGHLVEQLRAVAEAGAAEPARLGSAARCAPEDGVDLHGADRQLAPRPLRVLHRRRQDG